MKCSRVNIVPGTRTAAVADAAKADEAALRLPITNHHSLLTCDL
jgi:hypothetical protein